ncbi:MAG TPA: ABC transporter permease [Gammaproteobacteria bacterium]|nr:ABC transporter permease [Gammaproteobacteria bacterium]
MFVLYFRAALANVRLHKATALVNITGLTLGITCFVIAFAVADYFEHVNREFANAGRIYVLEQRNVAPGDDSAALYSPSVSLSLAQYVPVEAPEIQAVARKTGRTQVQVDAADQRFRLPVMFADPDLLRIFDYRFVDGDPGSALAAVNSAVITAPIAEQLFGTRNAAGKTFTINRRTDVVVGAVVETPDEFSSGRLEILLNFALRAQIEPRTATAKDRDEWTRRGIDANSGTFVLLPADGSLPPTEVERRLRAVSDRIVLPNDETVSFRVRPLEDQLGDTLTAGFGTLGIAPGVSAISLFFLPGLLVLAMACFNYVNLAAAVASTRAKDVGLSRVLGAERRHVIARYLFEAITAVLISLVLALLVAALGIEAIRALSDLRIGAANLATPRFALTLLAIAAATSVAAGAFPAYVMSRFSPIEALRKGSKRSGSRWAKSVFIGVQFAVASVLLTAVMVMFGQNSAMRDRVSGLGADPFVQIPVSLAQVAVDPDVLAAELTRAPQVKGVTGMRTLAWAGRAEPARYTLTASGAEAPVGLQTRFISYDFFATLGFDLVAGREFLRGRDLEETADRPANQAGTLAIVVDREAVRLLGWSTPQQAVGQVVYQRADAGSGVATTSALAFEIVGVVDAAPLTLLTLGTKGHAFHLDPRDALPIVRLAADGVQAGIAHIQTVWQGLADNPAGTMRPMFLDDARDQSLRAMNGLTTALLTVVAFGFSVALAGIFGMALFVANRRRHEIGIRKCLGANSNRILRQLLVEFGRPVVIGNVVAWPIGYLLADIYVQWFVARMSFTPWPYVASLGIALGLAWLGVGGQALRAARLIPARVLRDE